MGSKVRSVNAGTRPATHASSCFGLRRAAKVAFGAIDLGLRAMRNFACDAGHFLQGRHLVADEVAVRVLCVRGRAMHRFLSEVANIFECVLYLTFHVHDRYVPNAQAVEPLGTM
jgi:hypothetical protein